MKTVSRAFAATLLYVGVSAAEADVVTVSSEPRRSDWAFGASKSAEF